MKIDEKAMQKAWSDFQISGKPLDQFCIRPLFEAYEAAKAAGQPEHLPCPKCGQVGMVKKEVLSGLIHETTFGHRCIVTVPEQPVGYSKRVCDTCNGIGCPNCNKTGFLPDRRKPERESVEQENECPICGGRNLKFLKKDPNGGIHLECSKALHYIEPSIEQRQQQLRKSTGVQKVGIAPGGQIVCSDSFEFKATNDIEGDKS